MKLFRRSSVRAVGAAEIDRLVSAGALVVDVREPNEWDAGHLPFAVHIPMGEFGTRVGELDAARLTVFVCRSGNRSGTVAEALAPHGYEVANLTGGMGACARAELPVIRTDGRPGVVL